MEVAQCKICFDVSKLPESDNKVNLIYQSVREYHQALYPNHFSAAFSEVDPDDTYGKPDPQTFSQTEGTQFQQ